MSDSKQDNRNDKRDRWKMIASLLGATVPEESVPEVPVLNEPTLEVPVPETLDQANSRDELDGPSPTATFPKFTSPVAPAIEPPKAKPARPAPAASNWNALCGELGVEVPKVVECKEVVPPPANVWREPTELDAPDLTAPDLTAPEWPTPQSDAPSERVPSLSFFDPDAALEVDTVDAEFEAEPDSDAAVDTVADQVEGTDRELAGDRSSARSGESPAVRRRRRRGRRRGGSAERDETTAAEGVSDVSDEADEPDGSDAPLSSAAPSSAANEGSGDGNEDQQVSERGRRSRRRRRRSPRREEVRTDTEEPIDGTDVDIEDVDEKPKDLDDDEELDDVELDDVDLDDDDDDDDDTAIHQGRGSARSASGGESRGDGEGTGRGKHKKIPTWEEAMSVIVSANIESRHRDVDGGKGRPRGPRRRGRSSNDRS